MRNNVGVISDPVRLSRTIGNSTNISNPSLLNAISGEVNVGFIRI